MEIKKHGAIIYKFDCVFAENETGAKDKVFDYFKKEFPNPHCFELTVESCEEETRYGTKVWVIVATVKVRGTVMENEKEQKRLVEE